VVLYYAGIGMREAELSMRVHGAAVGNFWRTFRGIWRSGEFTYAEWAEAHGLSEQDIAGRKFDARYVSLMKMIEYTRGLFEKGMRWRSRWKEVERGFGNVQPWRTGGARLD